MDTSQDVVVWIADNVFSQVPVLIGLITLVGLLVQRKSGAVVPDRQEGRSAWLTGTSR